MMLRKSVFRAALTANVALAALIPSQAFAQTTPPATEEGVGEIIVTAQKRSENSQNVPIAITAVGEKEIAVSGITNTENLRGTVPSLNLTRGAGGFALPRIRGVGATGQGNGVENPVAIYVDGVYYAASSGALQSLFDAEQVAVLKGPQGTLFGRNATGGLIQISTLNPSLTTPSGKAEFGYGNYNTVRAAAFVTTPLTPTLGISASAQYEKRGDGFGRNVFTGTPVQKPETASVRVKLLWEPTADTRVLLAADTNKTDDSFPAFANFGLNTLGQDVPTEIRNRGGDPRYDIFADVDPVLRARQRGVSLTASHDFSGVSLKSITAFRRTDLSTYFDPDGITTPTLRILNINQDKTFTQELNLLSDGTGPFKWVLGGFYMNNKAGQYPGRTTGTTQFGGNGFTEEYNEVSLRSWSGFVEGSYQLSDATRFTAGIRYTSDVRKLNATIVTFAGATNTMTTTVRPEQSRSFSNVSWKLSLDHRFSDQVMGYASYNRGFRAGTFVPQANPLTILEPEVLDAFEIGLKTDVFDRRVRFNVAGFYYNQSTVQVQQIIAGVQNIYSARGGARIYGLDADLTLQLAENVRLFGGIGWTHARYKSFTDAIISIPFPLATSLGVAGAAAFSTTNYSYVDSVTGATVANTVCLGTFVPPNITTQAARNGFYRGRLGGNCLLRGDLSGGKLQATPDLTLSLGGNWDIPSSVGTFSLGGNVYHNAGFLGSADGRVVQPAFTTVNASVGWRDTSEKFSVKLWANNLTDTFYRTQLSATNSGDNGTAASPRTYGVTLGVNF
jgi:iron complex outermembrane recepter protein